MFCAHFQHDLGYNHQTLWIYVFLYIFYFSKKKKPYSSRWKSNREVASRFKYYEIVKQISHSTLEKIANSNKDTVLSQE